MGKIITCIDGSLYADSVCALSAWISSRLEVGIALLHVASRHSEDGIKGDLSGQIGLGAKSSLLEELTKIDEEHGKLEQKKGRLMLEHASELLAAKGVSSCEKLHRYGSLVENIVALETDAALIIMGKRGESRGNVTDQLGSNLELVARAVHKPLLVASNETKPIARFLIAYDGSNSSKRAVDYIASSPLFDGLECHILTVGDKILTAEAAGKLQSAGFIVHSSVQQGKSVEDIVSGYITTYAIDLLVLGAYGHSKIRNLILGSTTSALIRRATIPVLLFR